MRVYVACLAAYNNGHLHGEWIDVDDADTMREKVAAMLAKSPIPNAEEWAVHDYDGIPSAFGEYPDFAELAAYKDLVEEHDEDLVKAAHDVSDYHASVADIAETIRDRYAGQGDTLADWCEQFADDTGMLDEMPEKLRPYFDFEAYARDLQMGGDVSTSRQGGTVYVFWNH